MGLLRLLAPLQGGVICFTGAGGKTSLLYRLAEEIERAGSTAICTTTENFLPPPPGYYAVMEEDVAGVERPTNIPFVIVGRKDPENSRRYMGYSPEEIDILANMGQANWLLVETGPSQGRYVMSPDAGQIKYPASTKLVIGMIGLSVVNQFLDDIWVKGVDEFSKLSGMEKNTRITEEALARVAADPNGIFRDVPAGVRKILFLNHADTSATLISGQTIAGLVIDGCDKEHIEGVCIGAAMSGTGVVYEYHK